jgi:hypothetical protein
VVVHPGGVPGVPHSAHSDAVQQNQLDILRELLPDRVRVLVPGPAGRGKQILPATSSVVKRILVTLSVGQTSLP